MNAWVNGKWTGEDDWDDPELDREEVMKYMGEALGAMEVLFEDIFSQDKHRNIIISDVYEARELLKHVADTAYDLYQKSTELLEEAKKVK
jgi:hypothetical protein